MASGNTETRNMMILRSEEEIPLTPECIDGYLEHLRSVG